MNPFSRSGLLSAIILFLVGLSFQACDSKPRGYDQYVQNRQRIQTPEEYQDSLDFLARNGMAPQYAPEQIQQPQGEYYDQGQQYARSPQIIVVPSGMSGSYSNGYGYNDYGYNNQGYDQRGNYSDRYDLDHNRQPFHQPGKVSTGTAVAAGAAAAAVGAAGGYYYAKNKASKAAAAAAPAVTAPRATSLATAPSTRPASLGLTKTTAPVPTRNTASLTSTRPASAMSSTLTRNYSQPSRSVSSGSSLTRNYSRPSSSIGSTRSSGRSSGFGSFSSRSGSRKRR